MCACVCGGVLPVPQSQDVAHHGHDGQGAGVVGPPVEPHLEGGEHSAGADRQALIMLTGYSVDH